MKNCNYKPGNPEYDYWNDKSLYPNLRHVGDDGFSRSQKIDVETDDGRVGGGSVLLAVLVWLVIFTPFALFSTLENWLVQVIFWSGVAVVVLVFVVWLYGVIEAERQSKVSPEEPTNDPNLPWYKKYPPADVIETQRKK